MAMFSKRWVRIGSKTHYISYFLNFFLFFYVFDMIYEAPNFVLFKSHFPSKYIASVIYANANDSHRSLMTHFTCW